MSNTCEEIDNIGYYYYDYKIYQGSVNCLSESLVHYYS